MIRTRLGTRFAALLVAGGVMFGGAAVATTALASGPAAAAAHPASAHPFIPPMPPGTFVKCTQISGTIKLNPGVGLTGTSSGVKWTLAGIANNCTVGGAYGGVVFGALVKGNGYIVGGNTCAGAMVATNYGASTLQVKWFSTPSVAPTTYSTVATGAFLAGTTIDATGLTQNRLNTGPSPVSLNLGAEWTPASAALLATDCSGPAPASRLLTFQTPGSTHNPAFGAAI